MNNHATTAPIGPGGVPDLGAIGQQQVQVVPSVLGLRLQGLPQGLVDAVTLVALIREAVREDTREIVREELHRLLEPEEMSEVEQTLMRAHLEEIAKQEPTDG